jgi:hypothetical protein
LFEYNISYLSHFTISSNLILFLSSKAKKSGLKIKKVEAVHIAKNNTILGKFNVLMS